MKSKILIFNLILLMILLTNFLSAYEITITSKTNNITIYSGETKTINLTLCHDFKQRQELNLSYNITNNTLNLEGVNISFSKNPVLTKKCEDVQLFITISPLYEPDSWNLEVIAETFYEEKKYVSKYPIGGDGGGSTLYNIDYEEWQCGGWSACVNEKQTRTCTDLNHCGTRDYKPITFRACSVEETEEKEGKRGLSSITGEAITAFAKSDAGSLSFALLGAVGIVIVVVLIRRRIKMLRKV